jgi:hypothetical protein
LWRAVVATLLASVMALPTALSAQKIKPAGPAIPVPAQVIAARKVFILNAGGESLGDGATLGWQRISGGPDRAYNEFYADMKRWGRYELLPSPSGAELILEIQYTRPPLEVQVSDPDCTFNDTKCATSTIYYYPQFELIIRDPATQTVLGTLSQTAAVEDHSFASRRDRRGELPPPYRGQNISEAISELVHDLASMVGQPWVVATLDTAQAPIAPMPVQIVTARKLFITQRRMNDSAAALVGVDSAGSDRAYNDFYAVMKQSGRYELLSSPAGADLILEITSLDKRGRSSVVRDVSLLAIDPRTQAGLWGIIQYAQDAVFPGNANKNFLQAVTGVANTFLRLAGQPAYLPIPKTVKPAPPPDTFRTATKVFIANEGGHFGSGTEDNDPTYTAFYAAMKSWGHYELVATPGAADAVFQIAYDPVALKLFVIDPGTKRAIWSLVQVFDGQGVFSKEKSPYEFDQTIEGMVKQVAVLAGQPDAEIFVPENLKPAPMPLQLAAARKFFLAFPGYDRRWGEADTEQLYQRVSEALKTWNGYQLVASPAEADLIADLYLEQGPVMPPYSSKTDAKLVLRDPRTNVAVWGLSSMPGSAFRKNTAEKNFMKSLDMLVEKLQKALASGVAPAAVETKPADGGAGKIPTNEH